MVRFLVFCSPALFALAAASPALAQNAEPRDGARAGGQRPYESPDFLLSRPTGTIGIRGSWVFSRADSDIYDFVERQLTIDRGDFNAPAFVADFGFAISPHLDIVGGLQYSRSRTSSEYRDLVDNEFLPIEQRTSLKMVDLSGSVRFALKPRGREVSRFAWVPQRLTPYVGGGGGALWYELEQAGDFVDAVDFSVFNDVFRSKGWTPSAHAFGGMDIHLHKRLFATIEGRYLWAKATLDPDFVGFEPIDLAGFRLAAGINILY